MNKRGQFYLVGAIIIILVLFSLASIRTYAVIKPEPRKIEDISSELKLEGTKIIDYGLYNKKNITEYIENFIETNYSEYFFRKTQNTSLVFIYGNATDLYSMEYTPSNTGTVYATLGGAGITYSVENTIVNRTRITGVIPGEKISVTLLGKTFEFKIEENEMFYFIIAQKREGEIYIVTNNE